MYRFMMTGAAAQIPRPATVARLLMMNMPAGKPARLLLAIDALGDISHVATLVADKSMAGAQVAIG
jgi:hypothetical protein